MHQELFWEHRIYSWPLNSTGPLACGFFSVVNTAVLYVPRLVESVIGWIRGCGTVDSEEPNCIYKGPTDCKLYADFWPAVVLAPLTHTLFKSQLYSFYPQNSPMKSVLFLPSFYSWGNCSTETLSGLFRVTQLVGSRARIQF